MGVTRWDRIRNDGIRRKAGIEETIAGKVDRKMLRWFGHIERMNEGCWPRKVEVATVEGHQGRGRPRFGWLKRASAVSKFSRNQAFPLFHFVKSTAQPYLVSFSLCSHSQQLLLCN